MLNFLQLLFDKVHPCAHSDIVATQKVIIMKEGRLAARIDQDILDKFKVKCRTELGRPYQEVVREMIEASIDDRLTIKPRKQYKGLYK